MLHVVTTTGAYYLPVVTTWKILTTGTSYLTTGTLCIVTYHKHIKIRRFFQGLFDSQSPESSPEWEACGSWWSRGRRWGRGAGSSQRWRSTPAHADEMKLATKKRQRQNRPETFVRFLRKKLSLSLSQVHKRWLDTSEINCLLMQKFLNTFENNPWKKTFKFGKSPDK